MRKKWRQGKPSRGWVERPTDKESLAWSRARTQAKVAWFQSLLHFHSVPSTAGIKRSGTRQQTQSWLPPAAAWRVGSEASTQVTSGFLTLTQKGIVGRICVKQDGDCWEFYLDLTLEVDKEAFMEGWDTHAWCGLLWRKHGVSLHTALYTNDVGGFGGHISEGC